MKGIKKIVLWSMCWVFLSIFGVTATLAQESPIKINLVTEKTSFLPGEPIKMQISVFNNSGEDVITHEGFSNQEFHLMIVFTDPDGQMIRTKLTPGGAEPGPPARFEGRDVIPAELILSGWNNTIVMDNAHDYYDLVKYGLYTAQIFVALETFSEYVEDLNTGSRFAYLDDAGRLSFNPVASNKISFEIVPLEPIVKSSIEIEIKLFKVEGGGSIPPVTKKYLEGIPVHLIRQSDIPADYYPFNYKTYPMIWDNVDPVRTAYSDSNGVAKFDGVEKDNYLVLGLYDRSQDFRQMGSQIDVTDTNWGSLNPIKRYLTVMEKPDGKKVSVKTTKRTGSELLIHEPEFMIWDSTQELYSFVFESIGDWGVNVSVAPPEGFVADNDSLSTDVSNETESLQFTITDIGSRWEETGVTYKIKHKGKTEIIKSKIGIKLSEKLSKEKGLGIYGHTESPGPFKGGRKVSHPVGNVKEGGVKK